MENYRKSKDKMSTNYIQDSGIGYLWRMY